MNNKFVLIICLVFFNVSICLATTTGRVKLETSQGNIILELNSEKAPISVRNFMNYVRSGFYDGVIFHRVIPNFMIQGGGFNKQMRKKPTSLPIKNEADNGLQNKRGTIAMARTNEINSATAQFFINLRDNHFLNNSDRNFGYAVFGKVISGMEIVDKIAGIKTDSYGPYQNVPVQPIVIKKATVQ